MLWRAGSKIILGWLGRPSQIRAQVRQPKELMCPKKIPLHNQREFKLNPSGVWQRLPEKNRSQCRQLLSQMLRQVVLPPNQSTTSESSYER